MRPTHAQEVVFESTLEARVAAQLLADAGKADLLDGVAPPIPQPTVGRLEFVAQLGNEQKGRGDTVEYTCPPDTSLDVVKALIEVVEIIPPGQPTFSRKKYMGQRLVEFSVKLDNMPPRPSIPNSVEVGGMTVIGASDEDVEFLRRREAFVSHTIAERGWDVNNLSFEQLLEIRKLSGWQNPPELS